MGNLDCGLFIFLDSRLCSDNGCFNGGVCTEDPMMQKETTCACPLGYQGTRCETGKAYRGPIDRAISLQLDWGDEVGD